MNEILLFASTRNEKNRYTMRPLQVSEIIGLAMENTAELVREAGFVVEQHLEADLPGLIGDLSALSQCLQNLIGNAIKYSGQTRWISIRACLDEARIPGHREIQIAVEDRGIGIDKSELPHIFEPFYRSPAVSAAQIHGTGLGLPLAKTIAEAMNGKLTVESKLGTGSTFTLHLPVAKQKQSLAAVAAKGRDAVAQK